MVDCAIPPSRAVVWSGARPSSPSSRSPAGSDFSEQPSISEARRFIRMTRPVSSVATTPSLIFVRMEASFSFSSSFWDSASLSLPVI
ncbi:hypothetical protein D3C71_1581940 [compost metagenome]